MPQRDRKTLPDGAPPRLPVWLIGGDDDYLVGEAARDVIRTFLGRDDEPSPALEILRTEGTSAADVLNLLSRLDEALQSPSLFAERKIVWLPGCSALTRTDRPKSQQVLNAWKRLADRVKGGKWPPKTGLVISGPPPDGTLAFVKSVQARGAVVAVGGRGREGRAGGTPEGVVSARLRQAGKTMSRASRELFLATVGTDARRLASEVDKLVDYVGEAPRIETAAVREISSPGTEHPVWDLADALGERRLDAALRLVGSFLDRGESAISLLMGLVQRVRLMIAVQDLVARGRLRPDEAYPRFKSRLDSLPDDVRNVFPADRRLNPLAQHPFVLYKVAGQAAEFAPAELEGAMHALADANRCLVAGGSGRERLVLETALIRILRP